MSTPAPFTQYAWRSAEFPLCVVDVPVEVLAERWGITLVHWEEPGLGHASGFGCKLVSGLVVLLEEFSHAREHLGVLGPTLYVEANELIEHGIEDTLASVLSGLGLPHHSVTWLQTESGLQAAMQVVEAAGGRVSASRLERR